MDFRVAVISWSVDKAIIIFTIMWLTFILGWPGSVARRRKSIGKGGNSQRKVAWFSRWKPKLGTASKTWNAKLLQSHFVPVSPWVSPSLCTLTSHQTTHAVAHSPSIAILWCRICFFLTPQCRQLFEVFFLNRLSHLQIYCCRYKLVCLVLVCLHFSVYSASAFLARASVTLEILNTIRVHYDEEISTY